MIQSSGPQHKIIETQNYFTVKLDGELNVAGLSAFEEDLPKLLNKSVIFNCESVSGMDRLWIRALVNFEIFLRKHNLGVRMIYVKSSLAEVFRSEGVDGVLKISPNLRVGLVELGLVTNKIIDTEFINPFLTATLKVLEIQASTKAVAGKIYLKKADDRSSGDISGVIGLVSEAFNGSVVISFPEKTFLTVISRMLGEEFGSITKELENGAGELTNIIFGQAKIGLNDKGYGIKTALPSVIVGRDHSVSSGARGITVVVPFGSDAGEFFVEINTGAA
jgi:chemotaxis protein CheX